MTWAKWVADANQMRHPDLKGREGGTRAELDKLWNDNAEHTAGWTEWLWHSLHIIRIQQRQVHPNNGNAAELVFWNTSLTLLSSSMFLLIYCTGVLYACGAQGTEHCYAHYLGLFVLHVGSCYWKLSGSFFMWAVLQWAWPWACPRPGSAALCSGLATKCISLTCGPWPLDAFPDPGNRINTSAWALGDAYTAVHETGPVHSDPAS